MEKSDSIKELTQALAKARLDFLPIKRTEKVDYQTTSGRKKYNYAPLSEVIEATKKALSDNGLAITQTTELVDGNTILETLLSHSSGEWRLGKLYVGKQDQLPQSEGSALTYKRRYGMSAMLNVASDEDDDGEGAGRVEEKKTPPEPAPSLTPQQLYETALTQKTGVDLCAFALKHGWTKERLQTTLGIKKSVEIVDVRVAAKVLFPEPKSRLVAEAEKLGAVKEKGG